VKQVFRKPEGVKVPDRIDEDLGNRESPDESRAKKQRERQTWQCGLGNLLRGRAVENTPGNQPDKTKTAHDKKCRLPAEFQNQAGNDGRSKNGANGRATVKYT
jgi:hypothetical protein